MIKTEKDRIRPFCQTLSKNTRARTLLLSAGALSGSGWVPSRSSPFAGRFWEAAGRLHDLKPQAGCLSSSSSSCLCKGDGASPRSSRSVPVCIVKIVFAFISVFMFVFMSVCVCGAPRSPRFARLARRPFALWRSFFCIHVDCLTAP